jgi:hypothetical protein
MIHVSSVTTLPVETLALGIKPQWQCILQGPSPSELPFWSLHRTACKKKKKNCGGEVHLCVSAILAFRDKGFDTTNIDSFSGSCVFVVRDGPVGMSIANLVRAVGSRLELVRRKG